LPMLGSTIGLPPSSKCGHYEYTVLVPSYQVGHIRFGSTKVG
jgi:hypothetical protein